MGSKNSDKSERDSVQAMAKIAEYKRKIEREERRVRQLALEEHKTNDGRISKLQKQEDELRTKLHRLRLHMSRKKYSIRCHEQKIAERREALAVQAEKEARLVRQQQAVQAGLRELTDQYVGRVRAEFDAKSRNAG